MELHPIIDRWTTTPLTSALWYVVASAGASGASVSGASVVIIDTITTISGSGGGGGLEFAPIQITT